LNVDSSISSLTFGDPVDEAGIDAGTEMDL
jgi:hypothetical protein